MKKILLNQPYLEGNEKKYLNEVIESGWLARGEYVKRFEEGFKKEISHTEYALAVTSGTVAVHVAIRAVGLNGDNGEEVYIACPAYTCMSVPAAIKHANCEPVFIDIELETFGMEIESVERMYKERPFSGLVLVHNYGFIARDTEKIIEFCKQRGVIVIEDASESHGAELNGKRAGSMGDVGAFSCRSEKMIGVGEGGMVVTNSERVYNTAYYWVNDARPSEKIRYYVDNVGWNFHMANALGAIGLAQTEQFEEIVMRKVRIGERYRDFFSQVLGTSSSKKDGFINVMKPLKGSRSVYWLNVVLLSRDVPVSRDDLMTILAEKGIETRPAFYPLNKLPPYRECVQDICENSRYVFERGIALPSNPYMTSDDVDRCLREFIISSGIGVYE